MKIVLDILPALKRCTTLDHYQIRMPRNKRNKHFSKFHKARINQYKHFELFTTKNKK